MHMNTKTNKTKQIHTGHWTVKNARGIRATNGNTFPAFDPDKLKQLMPGYQAWDNWLVRDEDGFVADVNGFRILIALVRPVGNGFDSGERIAYFYSADGEHYVPGGFLYGDHKLYDDIREWSGSTILRADGKLQTFYTCAYGADIDGVWQTVQRLATAIQEVTVEGDKLTIETPTYHALMGGVCEPDGFYYETPAQASEREAKWPTRHRVSVGSDQTENNCMRDPFFYKDKRTGKRYLAFEANTGAGFHAPGHVRAEYVSANGLPKEGFAPTEDMLKANGCIGIIELTDDEGTFGQFQAPWLTANLVTDEIERINVVDHDGHVYLFCVGHGNKNALNMENADLTNRDYMLGFRAPYFGGPLTPLNGSGVVVQQKSYGDAYAGQMANQQYVYSWLITPTRDQKLGVFPCVSYANYCDTGKGVEAVMNAGPSVRIEIDGLKTRIVGMMYDIQPAQVDASREADKGSATEHGYA
ncbi:uncharacterized protein conserved in bacteria [Zymobacter palmae]|uniref:levansucrase n=2 Tax=Zymobacter palmae TaxID=33074 RepID=A0A348HED2_9GAMM|nr:uncharacterized protein conserved in bacteria [Zymobacter palmae]